MIVHEQERAALDKLSADIGRNPALVQAAGGNVSVKQDGILWIKASGTWLMHALDRNIMVPVSLPPLLAALEGNDPAAEKAQDFVIQSEHSTGLRPSIETTLHAVLPQKYVLHVHCLDTISLAVRDNAEALFAERFAGLNWIFVPYIRPGLPLSRAIAEKRAPETDIVVLGNHGLVVAAQSLEEAAALLRVVRERLNVTARSSPIPDTEELTHLANDSSYGVPAEVMSHGAATDTGNCQIAAGGSLYPDHVIFLGAGSVVAAAGEDANAVRTRHVAAGFPEPISILFPGKGVLIHKAASRSAEAMARCLADVVSRIPHGVRLNYLTAEENNQLLNWDAEKYRQDRSGQSA